MQPLTADKNRNSKEKTLAGRLSPGWSVLLLAGIIVFAYAPVSHYGFVNYDDPQYVANNPNVTAGLTWHGVKWAFTTGYQSNWHPLAWLSHMLDVQLFGANVGAHHLTNVALHIANTLLLFWFLAKATKAPVKSTVIAAFFAVHPLHVESVAWIAERKDVLSTFFGMLTLCSYAVYVRRPRPSTYSAVIIFFALGLMAKPMLVTLPFVLLFLDFWPLRRFTLQDTSNVPQLIREKIPLLMLTIISSIVTFVVQQAGGSVVDALPITTRVANAFVGYLAYLQRMFWPTQLAVLYPAAVTAREWWWVAAFGLLALSILSVLAAERRPYVPVGWFWYLGTLVPVIGLVQVGRQATADRYTYVPLIGIFLIVVFGVSEALRRLRAPKYVFVIAGGITIAACVWQTRAQLAYWVSSHALWAHTLSVIGTDELAHFNLAVALQDEGQPDEAISQLEIAARLDPKFVDAHRALGKLYAERGRPTDAAAHYEETLRLKPDEAMVHNDLGVVLETLKKPEEAQEHFLEALRLKPDYADAHYNLGLLLVTFGRRADAIKEFKSSLQFYPNHAEAHDALGAALFESGLFAEAVREFAETERLKPGLPGVRENLETARRAAVNGR